MKYSIKIEREKDTYLALDSFPLKAGRITFLFGESGIGKTLLARSLYGSLSPVDWKIQINDLAYPDYLKTRAVQNHKKNGFFVFQEPSSHLNPLLTLGTQLQEGDLAKSRLNKAVINRLWSAGQLETLSRIFPKPHRPSGGEKQRILLSMAFKKMAIIQPESAIEARFFVFDEPTGNLDNSYRNQFLQLLMAYFDQQPLTVLFITHDYTIIRELYDNHKRLAGKFEFLELKKNSSGHTVAPFAPEPFLKWLNSDLGTQRYNPGKTKNLLTVESSIHVHNLRLIISRNPDNQSECPLVIKRGEMVYLKAASGVGKTTVAKSIMGLVPVSKMVAQIGTQQLNHRSPLKIWKKNVWAKTAGLVFQHADEALNLNGIVRDTFTALPVSPPLEDDILLSLLKSLIGDDIDERFLFKRIKHLSGGQKQKINLLRTLVLDTDLLILDEPLNGLDFASIRKVLNLILKKQKEGKSILLISHNEDIFDHLVPEDSIYYLRSESVTLNKRPTG